MRAQESSQLFRRRALRVLLLGAGRFAALAAQEIEARAGLNYKIIGVVEEDGTEMPAELASYPRLGTPVNLARIVEASGPDRIIVALADRRGRLPALALIEQQLRGVVVEEASEVWEQLSGKLAIETLQPGSQLFRDRFRYSLFIDGMARFISFAFGLIGLVALAPLMAMVAFAIKITSKGPAFFSQKRIGLHGRPFNLLKFRTMSEAGASKSEWAADNAKRITPVGNLLRRLRLDELPQFINLVLGDMNLVGPRPHPVSNFALFTQAIPFYSLRCLVRPGLTGWAQIRYRYANNLAEETEKMRYDLYYIKHRSAWLDLQIIPATIRAVFAGKGVDDAPTDGPTPLAIAPAKGCTALMLVPPLKSAAPQPYETLSDEERLGLDWIPGAAVLRWGKGRLIQGTGALVSGTGALVSGTQALVSGTQALVANVAEKTTALVQVGTRALVVVER